MNNDESRTVRITSVKDDPITQYFFKKYHELISSNKEENFKEDVFESRERQSIFSSFFKVIKVLWGRDDTYEKVARLMKQKHNAGSYQDWLAAAMKLDDVNNAEEWKSKRESVLYDYCLIESRTAAMKQARMAKDWSHLLYLIRTTWVRNCGGMGNVNLYRHSYVSTKHIIEEYIEESSKSLRELVFNSDLDDTYLLGMLVQTRKNIGRTALVLSGGGTFGLFHIGILVTLFEQNLLPRVISGSSAGAIIASILCSRHKHEIASLVDEILNKDFNIFKDDCEKSEGENLLIRISRFFKHGTWFDNKNLVNTMINFLGNLTFREAYNRTGKILNITVSAASVHEQPSLLNNLTAPNVLIWSAVCASCSLPGIFPSSPLYEKDPKTGQTKQWSSSSVKFVDGSVENDLPISKLSEMFNVDHIIACQVNVHVFPFLKLSVSCVGGEIEDEFSARCKQALGKVYDYMLGEVVHVLEIATEIGVGANVLTKLRSILSQQYSGDITILPELRMLIRLNKLLSNPSQEFLLREATNGAKACWPKISIIKNHCGQEFELDQMINYLRGKIISNRDIKGNPFHVSNSGVPLVNSPVLTSNEKRVGQMFDDVLLNADMSEEYMVVRDKSGLTKNDESPFGLRPQNGITKRMHGRRKSDSSTNGIHRKKRHSSISIPHVSSSTSPMSERLLPTLAGYRPKLSRKTSTGDIVFSGGSLGYGKSNSFSRIETEPRGYSLTPILDQSPPMFEPNMISHMDIQSSPASPPKSQKSKQTKKKQLRKNADTA